MAVLKCKMCGGDLTITKDTKIVKCEFCGTIQTIPESNNEKKTNLFNRANRLRIASEFDRAAGIYESIIAEFPNEAEAYWGLCLCKFGIEYVDDPNTAEKIPTCHRTSFESIFSDSNYNLAILHSDPIAQEIYQNEAKAINSLQKNILTIVSKETPFDIFICYKETDDIGNRTLDSVLAQDIYDHLTEKGFKVFFSRITLEDKLGQDYEPYIFAALNSAKVMLAIGTNGEYYNAVWVKNEWSRYLSLMHNDRSKTLIPCYRDIDPYDMPSEFKNLQGQDMGKLGFLQDLTRGITKILKGSDEVRVTTTANISTDGLTKRGYLFLEERDFVSADSYFEKALNENPENSKAYVGKVLAALHKTSLEEINDTIVNLNSFKDFERALRFADKKDKSILESIKEKADRKHLMKSFVIGLRNWAEIKECDDLLVEAKLLTQSATVEGYEKATSIIQNAYDRRIDRKVFSSSLVESYTRRTYIIRLLSSDRTYYTISQIKESKYFNGTYVSDSVLEQELTQMIKDGSIRTISINGKTSYCLKEIADEYEEQRKQAEIRQRKMQEEAAAAEERRIAEKNERNGHLLKQIDDVKKQLKLQQAIYSENSGKIFGAGAKLKKAAKAEIDRLEVELSKLVDQLN